MLRLNNKPKSERFQKSLYSDLCIEMLSMIFAWNVSIYMMIQVCECSLLELLLELRALVFCTSQNFLQTLEEDWQACCQGALPSRRGPNVLCLSVHLHMRPTAVLEYLWSRLFIWSVSEDTGRYIFLCASARFILQRVPSLGITSAGFCLAKDKVSQNAQLFEQKSLLEFAAVHHGHRQTCWEISVCVSYRRSLKSIFRACARGSDSAVFLHVHACVSGHCIAALCINWQEGRARLAHRYALMLQRCVVEAHVIVSVISQFQSQVWADLFDISLISPWCQRGANGNLLRSQKIFLSILLKISISH